MNPFHKNAVPASQVHRPLGVLCPLMLSCLLPLGSSCGGSQDPTVPAEGTGVTKGVRDDESAAAHPGSQSPAKSEPSAGDPNAMEILTDAGVRRALLIGVQQYDNPRNNLHYTNKDAHDLARVLSASGWRVSLMTTDSPEAIPYAPKTILQNLAELAGQCEPEDTLLFYFSGHGASAMIRGRSTPVLIPMGFDHARPEETALFVKDVAAVLANCNAKTKLAWLDACRTTLFEGQNIRGLDVGAIDWGSDLVHFYYSTAPNTVSYESAGRIDPDGKPVENGWWTHFLVSGLRGAADQDGDHYVTLKELLGFVGPQLVALSEGKQEPYALSSGSTVREVRLTRLRVDDPIGHGPPSPAPQAASEDARDPRFLIDQVRHMDVARVPDQLGPMRARAGRDPSYRTKVISALAFHLGDMLERQLSSQNDHAVFGLLASELAAFGDEGAAALHGPFSISPKGLTATDLRLRIVALAAVLALPSVDSSQTLREAFLRPLASHMDEVVARREPDFRTLDLFLGPDNPLGLEEQVHRSVTDLVARAARNLYAGGQREYADRILERYSRAIPYVQLPDQRLLEQFDQRLTSGQWQQSKEPMDALLTPVAQRDPEVMGALLKTRCLDRLEKLLAGCTLQFQHPLASKIEGLAELGSNLSGYDEASHERIRQWLIAQLGNLEAIADVHGLRAWAQEFHAAGLLRGEYRKGLLKNDHWPKALRISLSSLPAPGQLEDSSPELTRTLEWLVEQDPGLAEVLEEKFASRAKQTLERDRGNATGFRAELKLAIRFGLTPAESVRIAYPTATDDSNFFPAAALEEESRIQQQLASLLPNCTELAPFAEKLARSAAAVESQLLLDQFDEALSADHWEDCTGPMDALLSPSPYRDSEALRTQLRTRCLDRLDTLLDGYTVRFQPQAAHNIESLEKLGIAIGKDDGEFQWRVLSWLLAQFKTLQTFEDVDGLRAWDEELSANRSLPQDSPESIAKSSDWTKVLEITLSSVPATGQMDSAAPQLETAIVWIINQDPSLADTFKDLFALRAEQSLVNDREDTPGFLAELDHALRLGLSPDRAIAAAYPKQKEASEIYPGSALAAEERILGALAERIGFQASLAIPTARLARSVVALENADMLARLLAQDAIAESGHSAFSHLLQETAIGTSDADSESYSFLCAFLSSYAHSRDPDPMVLEDAIRTARDLLLTFANEPSGDPHQLEAVAARLDQAAPLPSEVRRDLDRQTLAWTSLESTELEGRVARYLDSRGSGFDPGVAPLVFQHFYRREDWVHAQEWSQVASAEYSPNQHEALAETHRRIRLQADVTMWKGRRLLSSYSKPGKDGPEIANFTMVLDSVDGFHVSGRQLVESEVVGTFEGDLGDEVLLLNTPQRTRHGFRLDNVSMAKSDSLGVAQRYMGSFFDEGLKVNCAFLAPTPEGFPLDSLLHEAKYRGRLRDVPVAYNGHRLSPNTVVVARKHPVEYPLGELLTSRSAVVKGLVMLTAPSKESSAKYLPRYLSNGIYARAYINGSSKPIWSARMGKDPVAFEFRVPKGTYRIQIAADCEKSIGQYKLIFDDLTMRLE